MFSEVSRDNSLKSPAEQHMYLFTSLNGPTVQQVGIKKYFCLLHYIFGDVQLEALLNKISPLTFPDFHSYSASGIKEISLLTSLEFPCCSAIGVKEISIFLSHYFPYFSATALRNFSILTSLHYENTLRNFSILTSLHYENTLIQTH